MQFYKKTLILYILDIFEYEEIIVCWTYVLVWSIDCKHGGQLVDGSHRSILESAIFFLDDF